MSEQSADGINEQGVAMCQCKSGPTHPWEPGERCPPERVSPSDSPEKGIERFDPQLAGATSEGFLPMDRMPEGEFVTYEDHIRERDEAVARERERLREAIYQELTVRYMPDHQLIAHLDAAEAALDSLEER